MEDGAGLIEAAAAGAVRRFGLSCPWWHSSAAGKVSLTKPPSAPARVAPAVAVPGEPKPAAVAAQPERTESVRARTPAVQYVESRTTTRGREYTLRALGAAEPRMFTLLIPGEAFSSHTIRFQDGPDLCFRRLQRELTADPDLLPDDGMVLTAEEIGDYRAGREQPANERRRRSPDV